MIVELKQDEYKRVLPIIKGINNPVIGGVVGQNNRGKVFVDQYENPTTAFIWATNEMFFLCGNHLNDEFNHTLEKFVVEKIKEEALSTGDDGFNLELYPRNLWEPKIHSIFKNNKLLMGERVPFDFDELTFNQSSQTSIPSPYKCIKISPKLLEEDSSNIVAEEILKFWPTTSSFFEKGLGYSVLYNDQVVGTCIGVYVSGVDVEIGINTYSTEHRGKGLASIMAFDFIKDCLRNGLIPHWTTESFRLDSIRIAEKFGFIKQENYTVYHLPFALFK
ncbi:GNAT family N-acetyltransferase [Bacillus sp. 31A1R]|uniref:GNAT family N-acetyltransferase n=1 Tax=Robertmurraya mangrovi TaxID=3098077 RepID=A0ABU5IWW0_9BACI|nr:GNAT family N-acetyltransferase [Bacillus sp. 31A1R]MDZ5471622.1 GNAT family N-acetyltransferase [Bacillus sp. 31A1R]